MSENMIVTIAKAVIKGKLGIGKLTGKERFMLAQLSTPDRVPTMLLATNVDPKCIDKKFNYVMLNKDIKANLDLFGRICDRIQCDQVMAPGWKGFMDNGSAELGTVFKVQEDLVPYPVDYPIKEKADIQKIEIPEEASGHLKMYIDLVIEAQKRYPNMLINANLDGPWDLSILLRGDQQFINDLLIHKKFYETDDPVLKEKIKKRGDPDMYPAIMELSTQLAIRLFELLKQNTGSLMGTMMIDQYAAEPIMSRADFVKYVLPYIERVWRHHKKRLMLNYPCSSPQKMKQILENEPPGVAHQIGWSNYIFATTPEGNTLPEYDRPAFELAKKYKKNFLYIVHGKFLKDASEQELEENLKRVLGLATDIGVSLALGITSVPTGTDFNKVNFVFNMAEKYGRY